MKRSPFLLVILLCAAVGSGASPAKALVHTEQPPAGSDLHRLDPVLRLLLEAPSGRPPSTVHVWTDRDGTRRISALLSVRPGADLSFLTRLRARINSRGAVVSAEVPVAALSRLSAWPSLRYAEAARRAHLFLDRSVPEIRGDVARQVYRRTGKGVLIGVVDSGIDVHHPDFIDPDGHTRVRYLWDQTDTTGPSPQDFPYGREYTRDQIDDALAAGTDIPEKDDDPVEGGHGTHVAGIAAGGGGQTPFQGVAPGAGLIIVKADDYHGLDANRYIMARAASLGMPVVINNSWGGQNGPHDGTDSEARGLSDLIGPGRPGHVLCFAAGNSGTWPIHLAGSLGKDQAGDVGLNAPAGQNEIELEIWADAGTTFRFGLHYPWGATGGNRGACAVASGESATFDIPDQPDQPYANAHILIDARDNPYRLNPSLQHCYVHADLQDTPGIVEGLGWSLSVQRVGDAGTGHFDTWVTDNYTTFDASGQPLHGDTAMTLANQACVRHAIAVGSFISKVAWMALNDVPGKDPAQNAAPGNASDFSSQGPTRDGRQKPDLIAPGEWVASALSGDLISSQVPTQNVTPDGAHQLLEGTSMASPHAAGTVALLLEANPALDADEVRDFLLQGLRNGPAWQPKEGFGKLDAFEAVRRTVLQVAHQPGDLNGDEQIDLVDVSRALGIALGLVDALPQEVKLADVAPASSPEHPQAGDGRVNLADVTRILARSVGLEPGPWP